jgi:hypothetical protein
MATKNLNKKGNTMLNVLGASKPVTWAQEATKEITNSSNSHHIKINANYDFG